MPKTGWTLYQANMLSAVHNCPADPQEETDLRYKDSVDNYLRELAMINGTLPRDTDEVKNKRKEYRRNQTEARLLPATFDVCDHEVKAPSMDRLRL
jgi:hypothetical protein